MSFILEYDKSKCIFCDLPKSEPDGKNLIIKKFKRTFVLMNKFPYNNGHLMVAPFEHQSSLSDFEGSMLHELIDGVNTCTKALEKAFKPDGINIGINQGKVAGAGYEGHLHFHIVPRWNGDTNFMPVIAETKVMADHLENTYKKLIEFF